MDQPGPTHEIEQSLSLRQALLATLSPEVIEPILAGLRARAVADALERSGLAAVLIDGTGRVLHVVSHARTLLGQRVDTVQDHLVGRTRTDNAALQRAMTVALSGEDGSRDLETTSDFTPLEVSGLAYDDPSPFQLLRGVLILGVSSGDPDLAAVRTLLAD